MGINCPSCGGKMFFDIANQVLRCGYCDTTRYVEEYRSVNEAETQQMTYDSVVFTCRNCGAELTAPDEQTVAYCSYCGSEQMLTAKHEQLERPKKIIPFKQTKQQAMEKYAKALKGKLYVPKEYKDPNFLEGFRGIYLPYFSYNAVIPPKEVGLTGRAQYTSGGYDYDEDYNVNASLGGRTQDITFDASSAFDDTLANEIAPFRESDLVEFHEGYLAGLYADKATTSGATYLKAAEELAVDSVYKEIDKEAGHKIKVNREGSVAEDKAKLGVGAIDCEVSYFPVWFLTWRNKKRVAYSVMNGQTGKITMDIPVNKKVFLLVSLVATLVLFGLLSLLPMFVLPKGLCSIGAIILIISSILLHSELKKIYQRENHIYDFGDTTHKAKKKEMTARQSGDYVSPDKVKKSKGWIAILIPLVYVVIWAFMVGVRSFSLISELFSGSPLLFFAIALPIQLVFSVFMIMNASRISKKSAIIPAIIAPLVLLAGIVIAAMKSPYDYWYYGTALACLAAAIINCISAINYFNYLTTRPVPNFFRREGADNAK